MIAKRKVIGRTSLANRSLPMEEDMKRSIFTKAILRRNRVRILIGTMSNSAEFRGVIAVVRSSRGLGSSMRNGTRRLTSELIPCALLKANTI